MEKLIKALGKHKGLSHEQAAERIANVYGKATMLNVNVLVLPTAPNNIMNGPGKYFNKVI